MAEITAHKIQIDTCDVHYLTAGNPADKTVILLHGMKFQAATWQELGTLEQVAAAGFHAVAVDMPGFGKSPACSMEQDSVLEQFIQRLDQDNVVLVGPSMGGRIALEFTINHPEQVSSLVLVGAVGVEENRQRLGEIKVPTLIVWGSEDQISPPGNSDILHSSISSSEKIVIEGAPHPCYLDKPEQWHDGLVHFLTSLNS